MADEKPEPIPRKSPKKRSGPSMREQILARRREEAATAKEAGGEAPEKKAAPKPPGKPAAKARSAPKAAARPVKRAAASDGEDGPARPARPTSRASARRAGAGSSRRRGGDDEAGEGGGRRSRRERPEKKKSSALPLIAAGVVVIGGGAGAYFAGLFGGGEVEAAGPEGDGQDTATADAPGDGATEGVGAESTDPGEAGEAASTGGDADADADAETADAADAAEGDATAEDDGEPRIRRGAGLPQKSTEELTAMWAALEPFPRPDWVSEEEWAELTEQADMLFVDAGRASAQAEKDLSVDGKKELYPLILNRYLSIDWESEEQVMGGKSAARVLTAVRGSNNDRFDIGWWTSAENPENEFTERELRHDLMLVINLHKSWSKVVEDPSHWERLYLGEMYDESEEIMKGAAEDALEGLDDLDLDDLDLDDLDLDDLDG